MIYITIAIKKYIFNLIKMPKEQVNGDEFAQFLVHKLKLLKLGIRMLTFNDFHI